MSVLQPRQILPMACLMAAGLLAMPVRAEDGLLECRLEYTMEGWSAFYKTAAGQGTVICNDDSRMRVLITSRGGGITFGKSRIDEGRGEFYGIYRIRDVLGRYAAAEAHAGAGRSTKAQVVTKGSVSLALTGKGSGWDIGVSIGSFVLTEAAH